MEWLDCAGLALYFLRSLERSSVHDAVPKHVLSELKYRKDKNVLRMEAIRRTFDSINREFSRASINYSVLKGFSLMPEYCPDESLRTQADLDYLVSLDSLEATSRILNERHYILKKRDGHQSIFWIPSKEPISSAEQYDLDTPCVIELHTALWNDSLCRVAIRVPDVIIGPATIREWKGCTFPALADPQIFFHQILHVFQHIITGRVRLCHFLEIAHFLDQSASWISFWKAIERLLDCEAQLRSAVGLIAAMAQTVFPGRRAVVIEKWSKELSPVVQSWIEHYSRSWLIEGAGEAIRFLSSAKLVLLLQRQYTCRAKLPPDRMCALVPFSGLRQLFKPTTLEARRSKRRWQELSWVLSRILYHIGSNCRYLYELPRWYRVSGMLRN